MIRRAARALGVGRALLATRHRVLFAHEALLARRLEWRHRDVAEYAPPSADENRSIEHALLELGIGIERLHLDHEDLAHWRCGEGAAIEQHFAKHPVATEKVIEHYLAWKLLEIGSYGPADVYVDVASAGSPWANILHAAQINALALDLRARDGARPRFIQADATQMPFASASVRGMSLQCAFEMFAGDADSRFVAEAARVLRPGGRCLIVPLYMHTHHCGYSSTDQLESAQGDPGAVLYKTSGWAGIPFSRKYDAAQLKGRVVSAARRAGLSCSVLVLDHSFAPNRKVYCHFMLMLERPAKTVAAETHPRLDAGR